MYQTEFEVFDSEKANVGCVSLTPQVSDLGGEHLVRIGARIYRRQILERNESQAETRSRSIDCTVAQSELRRPDVNDPNLTPEPAQPLTLNMLTYVGQAFTPEAFRERVDAGGTAHLCDPPNFSALGNQFSVGTVMSVNIVCWDRHPLSDSAARYSNSCTVFEQAPLAALGEGLPFQALHLRCESRFQFSMVDRLPSGVRTHNNPPETRNGDVWVIPELGIASYSSQPPAFAPAGPYRWEAQVVGTSAIENEQWRQRTVITIEAPGAR